MAEIVVYYRFGGEWKEKEDGSYKWCPRNKELKSIVLLDDPNKIKYSEIVDCIFERLPVSRRSTDLKLSYIPLVSIEPEPKFILDDFDAKCYLLDRCAISQRRSILHVELIKNNESGEANDKERLDVDENEELNNLNDEIIQEDYFDKDTEEPMAYDATSAKGCEGDRLEETTLEETFLQETTASAATPKQKPSCVEQDIVVDHCEPLAIDDGCVSFNFYDGMGIAIGQEFASKNEVKNLVINASLKTCFDFHIVKSTTKLFVVKCVVQDCKWALRAAKIKNSDRFSLRTYYDMHTCSSSSVDVRNRQATAEFVADMLRKEFPGQLDTPAPSKVVDMMRNRGVSISYHKALRAKKKAASDVRGAPEHSFELLPSYLHMLKIVNPGTITHLLVDNDQRFKYFFIALGACIEGFKAMRKVIAVDGTFLKTKYKGTLIIATAQDGNYHQYPLAFGVVDSENDNSWKWFMHKLQELIPDDEELVIISDRHQSIRNAVADVYKKSQHGFCAWHISQNIKSRVNRGSRAKAAKGMGKVKVKDAVVTKFMQVAAAYTVQEFNKQYDELKNRYPIAAEYLEDNVDVSKWARCYFTGSRYNILTTNGAESINSVLKKARTYPILPLIDAIVNKISEWFNKHRRDASVGSLSQLLTPVVEKALHARHKESTILKVQELNRTALEYFVTGSNGSCLVDLGRGTCTCKVFDIDKFPCIHALAAYQEGPDKMHNLCSKYYLKELWALAYVRTIYPVPDLSEWDIPEDVQNMKVLPPDVTTKRGRIQQTRFPSVGEHRRGKNKRSRKTMIADASLN